MIDTWGGLSEFDYTGDVLTGTHITYGRNRRVYVNAQQYADLRAHFLGRASVVVGASRTSAASDSLGAWLQANVTGTAIASYVAPILVHEGYAERVALDNIRVIG